jgi:hypothetical protein
MKLQQIKYSSSRALLALLVSDNTSYKYAIHWTSINISFDNHSRGTYDVVGDTPVVEDPNDVVDDTLVVTVVVGTWDVVVEGGAVVPGVVVVVVRSVVVTETIDEVVRVR